MAFIGKNVIENLTTAMYENFLIIYREYIQNAADSIDKAIRQGIIDEKSANIDIEIDKNKKYIAIEDNGAGIAADKFKKVMSSIADSNKDSSENKGFRGIGRLGGISTCRVLKFSCSSVGENKMSVVTWDAQKVRNILEDVNQNPEASKLVDDVTKYEIFPCDVEKHFFKVELIDVEKSASELLEIEKIKKYLSSVAPLPYATGFIFASKIHEFAAQHGFSIDEYNVFVNGDRLFKKYTTKLYEDKGNRKVAYDEVVDIKCEIFRNTNDEILGWMWYGISGFEKQIPIVNDMRGIRLRKGNIQIGNEQTFVDHDFYKEPRGYLYLIGEVFAVHPELRPNARRDYFNLNDCCRDFENILHPLFCDYFYSLYHRANQYKKAHQKKQELEQVQREYEEKEQSGFDSYSDKKEIEDRIEKLTIEAEKAEKTIETRETKGAEDDVLMRTFTAIKDKYAVEKSEKQPTSLPESSDSNANKNPYKNKPKFITDDLTQYSKKERRLIGDIYDIIKSILPRDMADLVINKIQEELSK